MPKYVFPEPFFRAVDLRVRRYPRPGSNQKPDSVVGCSRGNSSRVPSSRKLGPEVSTTAIPSRFTCQPFISQNRFSLPSGTVDLSSAFLNLQELQLNKTLLTWRDFTEYLLPHLSKLTSVELGYNRLDHLSEQATLSKPPRADTKLSTVNFDGNNLNNWSDICSSFAKYPTYVFLLRLIVRPSLTNRIPVVDSVDHLVLSLNSIECIPPLQGSEEGADTPAFGGLARIKSLALSSNHLRSWADINALADYCPMLETLNITSNPIIEG